MTTPGFPQLPNVELGNTASDFSSAVSSFAKGLQEERTRRRQEAMSNALMNLKMQEFLHPHPIHDLEMGPNGPENVWMNPNTMQEEGRSPAPQSYFYGASNTGPEMTPGFVAMGRQDPSHAASNVPLPPGTVGRDVPPTPVTYEGPTGQTQGVVAPRTSVVTPSTMGQPHGQHVQPMVPAPTPGVVPQQPQQQPVVGPQHPAAPIGPAPGTPGGGVIKPPTPQEIEKAGSVGNMAIAAHELMKTDPALVQHVIERQNIQTILAQLPVVGQSAGEAASALMALGLNDEEAKWLGNFNAFIGFVAPTMGGKQLTITELRLYSRMYTPLLGEQPVAQEQKRQKIRYLVNSQIALSGNGWQRLISDPVSASQIPVEFGGTMQDVVDPRTQNINPHTGRPRRP